MRSLTIVPVLIVYLDIRLRRKLLGKCPVSLLSLRPRCIKSSLTLASGPWDHEWGCLSPLSPSIGTESIVCKLCVLHLHLGITGLLIDSSSFHLEFYKDFKTYRVKDDELIVFGEGKVLGHELKVPIKHFKDPQSLRLRDSNQEARRSFHIVGGNIQASIWWIKILLLLTLGFEKSQR